MPSNDINLGLLVGWNNVTSRILLLCILISCFLSSKSVVQTLLSGRKLGDIPFPVAEIFVSSQDYHWIQGLSVGVGQPLKD
jgi:hypothetical protein